MSTRFLPLLLAAAFLAAPAQSQSPTFFITGSDPQFGMYAENKNFAQETANFEFFIANVNRLKPQFVVITGDLINVQHNPAQLAEYKRISGLLDKSIKLYSVPGNHDVGNNPTPADLEAYRHDLGPDYYSFKSPGIYGIVLDSNLLGHPEAVAEEAEKQETWLRAELKKAAAEPARQILVFQHIPWFIEAPSEPDQYFNIPTPIRARYLKLLHDSHVHYVFAGHTHHNYNPRDVDLEEVITTAIGKPLGPEPSGLRIVAIKDRRLEHTYFSLGNIPNEYPPPPPQAAVPMSEITGTVAYLLRMALPPDAVITIQMQDVSLQDAPAKTIAETTINPNGKQVPIPFQLSYKASDITASHTYAVRATIASGGRMIFTSTKSYPVITRGTPSKIDILVQPVTPTSSITLDGSPGGSQWMLTELDGVAPVPSQGSRKATLTLIADSKGFNANAGCNGIGGNYELPKDSSHPDAIRFKPGPMTMMACAEPLMNQEQAFVKALQSATSYRIAGSTLELRDGDRVLARFSGGPPPIK